MASQAATFKFRSNVKAAMFEHDPGSVNPTIVSPDGGTTKKLLPLFNFQHFILMVMNSVSASSSGPTLVELIACTDANGSNPTVIVSSGDIASTQVGDWVVLEANAPMMRECMSAAGLTFTHWGARITCSNFGDECCVFMGNADPVMTQGGLTANSIA